MVKLKKEEKDFLKTLENDIIDNNSLTVDEKCAKLDEYVNQYWEGDFLCSQNLLRIILEKLQTFQNLKKRKEQEEEYERIKKEIAENYRFQKVQVDLDDEINTDLFPWVSSEAEYHIRLWKEAGIVKTYQDLICLINNAHATGHFYTIKSAIEHVITKEQAMLLNSHMYGCGYRDRWTHVKDAEVFSVLDACGFGNMIFEHKYYLATSRCATPVNLSRYVENKYFRDIFDTYEDAVYYSYHPDAYHSSDCKIILAY